MTFRFRYLSPLRWGDLDAQQHVNNAVYLDHLQDSRVAFLYSAGAEVARMLDTGILVVAHQVEYLAPVGFRGQALAVDLWVDQLGGSRFVIGYEVHDGDTLCARARTVATPYDLAAGKLRRFSPTEREGFRARMASEPPLRELARSRPGEHPHRCPVTVRWSDLDAYGHVNNVKFYDYVQESRIAVMVAALHWASEDVWVVARQDLEYRRPMDFRLAPYEVRTSVTALGRRSFTLAADIRDPADGAVFATARTVLVGSSPLTDAERTALSRWAVGSGSGAH